MKLYLAQHRTEKTLLGALFSESPSELFDMVDAVANPEEYRYRELGSGAICFEGDEPSIRPPSDNDQDDQDVWSGATELGSLETALSDLETGTWEIFKLVEKRGELECRLIPFPGEA